jgi:transcription-repair coupling factor (superfamily II helicase)
VLQGNYVKFSQTYLRESQELRLKRVFPGSIVKKQTDHILVPRPKTKGFPAEPVTGLPLLEWCRSLIDGVISMGNGG